MTEQFSPSDSAAKRARAEAELRQLEERREALLTFLRIDRELDGRDSAQASSPQVAEDLGPSGQVPSLQVETQIPADLDLEGANNLTERLLRIAKATGGTLRVKEAAAYLINRGVYGGKIQNLRAHIYGDMKQLEDFVKVGKGVFDYRPGQEGRAMTLT